MFRFKQLPFFALLATLLPSAVLPAAARYVRVNQVGYLTADSKVAVAFSNDNLSALTFSILRASDSSVVWGPAAFPASSGAYNPFANTYKLDFSAFQPAGTDNYKIQLSDATQSPNFEISPCTYASSQEMVLNFYLVERCGTDNKYAGAHCHMPPGSGSSRMDGKVVGGPNNNALIDTEGAWHDSGDYIKFMITVGWSCENLLLAYRENPSAFADNLDAHGVAGPNGIPDVLDEAKYALDWIMKMNPDANTLYYQVGGQEDHNLGLGTLPQNDTSAYSTSPYRPVFYGNGSNTCGKAATCLAMASQIFGARGDAAYAATCLTYATRIYALGKASARIQDANPAAFYAESDWKDDMEWAAAEMYRTTGTPSYLTDAKTWAAAVGSAGGQLDWDACNFLAHYSLYPLADAATRTNLQGYMSADLSANLTTANGNPYGMATTFSWGSMEVLTGAIVKAQLYKKLFGVTTYDNMATWSRDFMLGKNPWGVSFIVGMGTTYAHHPQHNIAVGKAIDIPGMPIEGPDALSDWNSQGITLGGPDIYAAFQSTAASGGVYHDDKEDYATNECTTTHAGLAVVMFSNLSTACSLSSPTPTPQSGSPTPSRTPTLSSTPSSSKTPTPTRSATPSPASSPSSSPTASPSASASGTASASPTLTPSRSFSPSPTASASASPTRSVTPSPSQTQTPTPSVSKTLSPTQTGTASPSASATLSPALSPSFSPTSPLSFTASPSQSPTPQFSPSSSSTPSPQLSPSASPSASQTPSGTLSPSPMGSPSSSPTATPTSSPSRTASPTASPNSSATPSCSQTQSPQISPTATLTLSPTSTRTNQASPTPSPTVTATPTASPSSQAQPTNQPGTDLRGLTQAAIWPNPISGSHAGLAFELNGDTSSIHVKLYSTAMTVLFQSDISGNFRNGWNHLSLALPSLPNGCYFLRVQAGENSDSQFVQKLKVCKFD